MSQDVTPQRFPQIKAGRMSRNENGRGRCVNTTVPGLTPLLKQEGAAVMVANPNRIRVACPYCGRKRTITRAPNASLHLSVTLCGSCKANGAPPAKSKAPEPPTPPVIKPDPVKPAEPIDRATCWTRKARYVSEAKAREALAWLRFNGLAKRIRRTYECPYCHGWHLTHLKASAPNTKKTGAWK